MWPFKKGGKVPPREELPAMLTQGCSWNPDEVFCCRVCMCRLDMHPSEMMMHRSGETYICEECGKEK